jgi:2-furoyl-CoA dehydrogenase FAD binding subunit
MYVRPDSVEEALEVLGEYGDEARVLAGGQSLIPMLNFRLFEPAVLVDIRNVPGLDRIEIVDGALEIGAAVTQNQLLSWHGLAEHAPMLATTLPWVGHFQTRNRGTVCGSVAHSDPSAEIPLTLAMLNGEVVLRSKTGERRVRAREFQEGMLTTSREVDELITSVRFPLTAGAACAFSEVSRRKGDFAIVAIGAIRTAPGAVTLGIGGACEKPVVATIEPSQNLEEAIAAIADELETFNDIHASPQMRRDMVRRLAPRVIRDLPA